MKQDAAQALLETFGDAITPTGNFRGDVTFIVERSKIRDVCQFLHDSDGLEYKFLSDITAVDYYTPADPDPEPGRFALCYHLLSMRWNNRIRLKVYWSEGQAAVPSVTGVWQSANWEEREANDLFGIPFDGHPDLRRLMMPEDWQGFPGRRDYPLGYETVQFSFNADEIDKYKPYAKE